MHDREENIRPSHEGTFKWLLEPVETDHEVDRPDTGFLEWLGNGEPIFWISGKAGSGKSTLLRDVYFDQRLDETINICSNGDPVAKAAFFFFDRGLDSLQKSREGLLRSLIHQLLDERPTLAAKVLHECFGEAGQFRQKASRKLNPEWSWNMLKVTFEVLVSHLTASTRLYLFIDGLDEYRMIARYHEYSNSEDDETAATIKLKEEGHREIVEFFLRLSEAANIKLCLSSRTLNIFEDSFGPPRPHLRLHKLTHLDIEKYVNDKIGSHRRFNTLALEEPNAKMEFVNAILEKALGVFLWVRLVVERLLDGLQHRDRMNDLRRRLRDLPEELVGRKGLYMFMLADVSKTQLHRIESMRLFEIVRRSRHTLSPLDLRLAEEGSPARALHPKWGLLSRERVSAWSQESEERLRSRSAGLLEVDGRIQYLHQTVKDFMDDAKVWGGPPLEDLDPEFDANTSLMCGSILAVKLAHGLWDDDPEDRKRLRGLKKITLSDEYMALWGAIKNVIYYAGQAEKTDGVAQTKVLNDFDRFMTANFKPNGLIQSFSSQSILSLKGHWSIAEPQEQGGKEYEFKDDLMSMAVQGSLSRYLKAKLSSGQYKLADKKGRPLLTYAICPVRLRTTIQYDSIYGDTLGSEIADSDTVRVLLEHGADPNQDYTWNDKAREGEKDWTVWQQAIFYDGRHQSLYSSPSHISMLLEHGADPNVAIRHEESLLTYLLDAYQCWKTVGDNDCLLGLLRDKGAMFLPGEKDKLNEQKEYRLSNGEQNEEDTDRFRKIIAQFRERGEVTGDRRKGRKQDPASDESRGRKSLGSRRLTTWLSKTIRSRSSASTAPEEKR